MPVRRAVAASAVAALCAATAAFTFAPSRPPTPDRRSREAAPADAGPAPDCAAIAATPARVACLAAAFEATLTAEQRATVRVARTAANAARWSNLPVDFVPRNGLRFGALSAPQQAAALALVRAALGTAGYAQFQAIRLADADLAAKEKANGGLAGGPPPGGLSNGPPGGPPNGGPPQGRGGPPRGLSYGDGIYFVAFLGAPSAAAPWILQLGGHHLAVNLAYHGAATPAPTPNFVGVEPQTFTVGGVTYTPLQSRKVAMYALVNSLDSAQYAAARLGATFSDVLVGPGRDGQFPAHRGVRVSSLRPAQQQLVRRAIEAWVTDFAAPEADALLAAYEAPAALADTYVGSAGGRDFTTHGSYVRIDGPRVWIEFVCQNGIVVRNQTHFHTIWRDRERDYGGDFTF